MAIGLIGLERFQENIQHSTFNTAHKHQCASGNKQSAENEAAFQNRPQREDFLSPERPFQERIG
jgi:hypothetical protein